MQRTVTAGSETFPEIIYTDEASCEVIFRRLVNDVETDIARVVADRPGYLARSVSINSTGKQVEEHTDASERLLHSPLYWSILTTAPMASQNCRLIGQCLRRSGAAESMTRAARVEVVAA